MEDTRPVSISTRDMLRDPKTPDASGVELYDRRTISVRWYDRRLGRPGSFVGQIRIPSVPDLSRAAALFARLTGGVAFENLAPEVRNRHWLVAKLFAILDGQPGADALLDAFDHDRALLVAVWQEVDRLEAECFRDVLAASEGVAGAPRVVVEARRAVAPASPAATP